MQCVVLALAVLCLVEKSTQSYQSVLAKRDDEGDEEGSSHFQVPSDIKDEFPNTHVRAHGTQHFDIFQLGGHEAELRQARNAGFKFCLGCSKIDHDNNCHSLDVCKPDALCINGSFHHPLQDTDPDLFDEPTEPWYGCCRSGNSECSTRKEDIEIDIKHGHLDIVYDFETCNGFLCNAGKKVQSQVANFLHIVAQQWSSWNSWSTCNCSTNTTTRKRTCPDNTCIGTNNTQTKNCTATNCPVNGGWSSYTHWEPCSVTCGGGNQTRNRSCTAPIPINGGSNCTGDSFETNACNTQPCPPNGVWTNFTDWSTCDATCGGGNQSRVRFCIHPDPSNPGLPCSGHRRESQHCNTQSCPAYGVWTNFTVWSTCDATCGGGNQSRVRFCIHPDPSNPGLPCSGHNREVQHCNTQGCPVGPTTATQIANKTSKPITKVMSTTGPTQKSATSTKTTQTATKQSTQAITKQATQPTTNQTTQHTSTASSWLVTGNSSSLPGVTSVKPIATMPPKPLGQTTATQITNQTSQPITKVISTTGLTQKSETPINTTQTATKQSTQAITKQATQPTTNQTTQHTSTASSWLVTGNSSSLPGVTSVKPIATMPPKPLRCAHCAGPPEACEFAFYEDTCQPPNHYCINHVTNLRSGQRLVERKCGNITECYHDWYIGTSDDDKCRKLSSSTVLTYSFECTYCCVSDSCNVDLRPAHHTLYTNIG